jgi:hypothetical protein
LSLVGSEASSQRTQFVGEAKAAKNDASSV